MYNVKTSLKKTEDTKTHPMFMDRKNYVKMSIVPAAIYIDLIQSASKY